MSKEEIKSEDLAQYASEIQDALASVCASSQFRPSPKGREFLNHVVHHTLHGHTDELKERLIGIALLGRSTTYDTGSDAGVRVRANDVRKRLNSYNAERDDAAFSLVLPAGTYIPRFFRNGAIAPAVHAHVAAGREPAAPLSLLALAAPTLVALFVCTVCLRWQIGQEHPFTAFWQSAFVNHRALLYLPASDRAGGEDYFSRESIESAAPLLDLAGQFHTQFLLTPTPQPPLASGDVLVVIGSAEESNRELAAGNRADGLHGACRLVVQSTPEGRRIVDMGPQFPRLQLPGRAALLTIVNGEHRSIEIDGTDEAAIGALARQLSEQETFPADLAGSFQPGTVTQAVFPLSQGAHLTVLHEALPSNAGLVARAQ